MIEARKRASACNEMGRVWKLILLVALCVLSITASFGAGVGTALLWGDQLRRAMGAVLPSNANEQKPQLSQADRLKLLWDIEDILRREYINPEKLDEQKMLYGAAAGLVASLGDPHTAFIEPTQASFLEENLRGSFEGIGATVDLVEGRLVIVRVLPKSPALQAGLKAGDVILAVDDQSLEGKTILEAISLIRGPRGTIVRLKVQREGVKEPFIVPIIRDKVELPIIEARMLEEKVAYLRLAEFNALADEKVHQALKELLSQEPVGLILDLRGNPGGYLQKAIDVASEFLPRGTLVLVEHQRDKPVREYRVERPGLAQEVPLVVLINGLSASAAEIVAGAIRDSGRGVLIGEKTYGKGSVQNTHELQGGASLRVTIARWDLPSGRNLDGQGLEPDIPIPLTQDDLAADRDPQLERAVDYLLGGS